MVNSRLVSACIVGAVFTTFSLPSFAAAAQGGQAYNAPDGVQADPAAYQASATSAPEPVAAPVAAAPVAPADPLGGGLLEMIFRGGQPQAAMPVAPQADPRMTALAGAPDPRLQRTIDPMYLRQEVDYTGPQKAGTIVIDTPHKFLYLVEKGGKALRYGIGVGRPGFTWSGVKTISRKAEWPDWTPPAEMLKRRPDLPTHMAGGPENPLGARALYLGSSLYRIHGTNEPYTIGTNVSSGCIRMMNQDVEDLYQRVGVGTKVIVM